MTEDTNKTRDEIHGEPVPATPQLTITAAADSPNEEREDSVQPTTSQVKDSCDEMQLQIMNTL